MTERRRLVRVPASSANLGPGYDVLAAALDLHLELEVAEASEFSVDAAGLDVPGDRTNLCVKAFESLHSADGLAFTIRSQIPLARGLGSSAAAIVAGLAAADHMYELALSREALLAKAAELEGHPDNVAAAIYGGFVICSQGDNGPSAARFDPPAELETVAVIPAEEVQTGGAREAIPAEIPLADAIANVAAASTLVLGLQTSDLNLVVRGLHDRIHQSRRAHIYPRSMELVEQATELGALGATISGAGPTVLVWTTWEDTGKVVSALQQKVGEWAEVVRVPFAALGADVPEL